MADLQNSIRSKLAHGHSHCSHLDIRIKGNAPAEYPELTFNVSSHSFQLKFELRCFFFYHPDCDRHLALDVTELTTVICTLINTVIYLLITICQIHPMPARSQPGKHSIGFPTLDLLRSLKHLADMQSSAGHLLQTAHAVFQLNALDFQVWRTWSWHSRL